MTEQIRARMAYGQKLKLKSNPDKKNLLRVSITIEVVKAQAMDIQKNKTLMNEIFSRVQQAQPESINKSYSNPDRVLQLLATILGRWSRNRGVRSSESLNFLRRFSDEHCGNFDYISDEILGLALRQFKLFSEFNNLLSPIQSDEQLQDWFSVQAKGDEYIRSLTDKLLRERTGYSAATSFEFSIAFTDFLISLCALNKEKSLNFERDSYKKIYSGIDRFTLQETVAFWMDYCDQKKRLMHLKRRTPDKNSYDKFRDIENKWDTGIQALARNNIFLLSMAIKLLRHSLTRLGISNLPSAVHGEFIKI